MAQPSVKWSSNLLTEPFEVSIRAVDFATNGPALNGAIRGTARMCLWVRRSCWGGRLDRVASGDLRRVVPGW
jgi:hypothetical protein